MRDARWFLAYMGLFLAFALLFLYGKVPWDPCAYMLTGRHMLGAEGYYEALRAPVPSLLFGTLGIPGYFAASIVLLAAGIAAFSRRKRVSPAALAVLLLPPLAWNYYVYGGSEILATAFLLLGAAYAESVGSSLLFALTFLTRYAYAILIPFFLPWSKYIRDRRFAALHIAGIAIPVVLWMLAQWKIYGDPLASFIEFYYVNGVVHPTAVKLPELGNILKVGSISLALGIPSMNVLEGAMFAVALLFAAMPAIPRARFYLPILIPLALAGSRKLENERAVRAIVAGSMVFAAIFVIPGALEMSRPFYGRIAAEIDANCAYISNVWVPLECMGVPAIPPPEMESDANRYFSMLLSGYRAVGLPWVQYPKYFVDLNAYAERNIPVEMKEGFFVAGRGCIPPDVERERKETLERELNWFYSHILKR